MIFVGSPNTVNKQRGSNGIFFPLAHPEPFKTEKAIAFAKQYIKVAGCFNGSFRFKYVKDLFDR